MKPLQRFPTAIKQDIPCGTLNTENSDWHARVFVTTPAALLLMLLKVEEQSWTFHLTQIAHRLKEQGFGLKVLDQAIDTTTVTGKLLFDMLAAISEFETSIRKERQLEGISLAKSRDSFNIIAALFSSVQRFSLHSLSM